MHYTKRVQARLFFQARNGIKQLVEETERVPPDEKEQEFATTHESLAIFISILRGDAETCITSPQLFKLMALTWTLPRKKRKKLLKYALRLQASLH